MATLKYKDQEPCFYEGCQWQIDKCPICNRQKAIGPVELDGEQAEKIYRVIHTLKRSPHV